MKKIINKSKIAILLGVYNGELYIREQIESVLSQNFKDWTLFIRDDGSTDKTLMIVKEYSMIYSNIITIIDDDGNLGCNGNYFRLLSIIESDYYMFCNADDYWYTFKIEVCFERILLEESKHVNKPIIVHTDLSIADRNLNILAESYWVSTNVNPEKYKTYNKLGLCSFVAGATMLFNKYVKDLTFPVSKFAPFFDHWIALQVVKEGLIISIHKPTIAYRQIGTNLAAVKIGKENSIYSKIINIKKVLGNNINEAKMLNKIGWGSYVKYIIYKVVVLSILRLGNKYDRDKDKIIKTNN